MLKFGIVCRHRHWVYCSKQIINVFFTEILELSSPPKDGHSTNISGDLYLQYISFKVHCKSLNLICIYS